MTRIGCEKYVEMIFRRSEYNLQNYATTIQIVSLLLLILFSPIRTLRLFLYMQISSHPLSRRANDTATFIMEAGNVYSRSKDYTRYEDALNVCFFTICFLDLTFNVTFNVGASFFWTKSFLERIRITKSISSLRGEVQN